MPKLAIAALTLLAILYGIFNELFNDNKRKTAQLAELQKLNSHYQQQIHQSAEALDKAQALADEKQLQIHQLFGQTEQLNQQIQQRDKQLRELYREQDTVDWATTELPELIKQLRTRAACTSASDYREQMLNAHPLPASSNSTKH